MDAPSSFLYEVVFWLTMNVDGLAIKEVYKVKAYEVAANHVANCLMVSEHDCSSDGPLTIEASLRNHC